MKARVTAEERLRLIGEWQQSGMGVREWCRGKGIHPNTFCAWKKRSCERGAMETPAVIPQTVVQDTISQDIVKIEVKRDTETKQMNVNPVKEAAGGSASSRSAVMEIAVGSIRIKVTNQVSPQLVVEVIRQLGGGVGC